MKFKGILSITKVNENQTQNDKSENTIIFNNSKIELIDNETLFLSIKEREVLFVGSSYVNKKEVNGKVVKEFKYNWVNIFENCEQELKLSEDVTDILLVTREIYEKCLEHWVKPEDIYKEVRKLGLPAFASKLNNITDFSALIAYIGE